jgi:hypothetical protein
VKRLVWLGKKMRAPLWMMLQILKAGFDGDMARFVDRKGMTPARRLVWRLALTAVVCSQFVAMVAFCLVAGALGAVAIPFALSWGNLADTWQTGARDR